MIDINTEIAKLIDCRKHEFVNAAVTHYQASVIAQDARAGRPNGRIGIHDIAGHISHLSNAVAMSSPKLFEDYATWARGLFEGRGIVVEEVSASFDALNGALQQDLDPAMYEIIKPYVAAGMSALLTPPLVPWCSLSADEHLTELSGQYLDMLLKGDRQAARSLIMNAVEAGSDIQEIYLGVFQPTQYEIGRLWQIGRITVAQEHYCTAATQIIMSQLYSRVFASNRNGRTLVAACVGGDLHEMGGRMIADLFEMDGWNTFYFGANTPELSVVQAVLEQRAEILAISVTMPLHLRAAGALIASMRAADPDGKVTIIVGGYPFQIDPDLWRRVGADAYAPDARTVISMASGMQV